LLKCHPMESHDTPPLILSLYLIWGPSYEPFWKPRNLYGSCMVFFFLLQGGRGRRGGRVKSLKFALRPLTNLRVFSIGYVFNTLYYLFELNSLAYALLSIPPTIHAYVLILDPDRVKILMLFSKSSISKQSLSASIIYFKLQGSKSKIRHTTCQLIFKIILHFCVIIVIFLRN
jgi:hypothetical protein